MRTNLLSMVLLLGISVLLGCRDSTDTSQEVSTPGLRPVGGIGTDRNGLGRDEGDDDPQILDKIEASLKSDIEVHAKEMFPTARDIRLGGFSFSKDKIGYVLDIRWRAEIPPKVREPGLAGLTFGQEGSDITSDTRLFRSKFRYGFDGAFKRPIIDTVPRPR